MRHAAVRHTACDLQRATLTAAVYESWLCRTVSRAAVAFVWVSCCRDLPSIWVTGSWCVQIANGRDGGSGSDSDSGRAAMREYRVRRHFANNFWLSVGGGGGCCSSAAAVLPTWPPCCVTNATGATATLATRWHIAAHNLPLLSSHARIVPFLLPFAECN